MPQSKAIEYRGWTIRRRDNVPAGYHGRYTILGNCSFTTLREAKEYVDRKTTERVAAAVERVDAIINKRS